MSVKPSISFRNISTYIVEPAGEPIITQPANYSMDFSPQTSCMEEAPDDGNQYARQNKSWTEINIPAKTSDLTNDSGFITTESDPTVSSHIKGITTNDISNWNSKLSVETDPIYTSEKPTLALKNELTKESITGIKTTDTPEFVDTSIAGLKSDANGGSIPAAIYTWFKGLFTSLVDGSVKSYIIGILTVLKDLATRVGLLEDKYILKYVVPVDTNQIVLSTDKNGNAFNFSKGETIRITFKVESFVGESIDRVNLRINGISSVRYISGGNFISWILGSGAAYYGQFTTWIITLNDGDITGQISASVKTTNITTWTSTQVYDIKSIGLNISNITSLTLFSFSAGGVIPAGTIIEITK